MFRWVSGNRQRWVSGNRGGSAAPFPWILAAGAWDDTGVWDDTAVWKDS